MTGHASMPNGEDFERMTNYLLSVVKDAIAQPAADKHSSCGIGDECSNLIDRNRQASLPCPAQEEPCGNKNACRVGQSIPANTNIPREMHDPRIEVIDPVVFLC
jgi:hypothetical protein